MKSRAAKGYVSNGTLAALLFQSLSYIRLKEESNVYANPKWKLSKVGSMICK
jgi:hypothetical protein